MKFKVLSSGLISPVQWLLITSALTTLIPLAALADATVTNCTEADFTAALNSSSRVTFACDGTITLHNTVTISHDTIIDATGRNITISGGNAVRLFLVNSHLALTAINLVLAQGSYTGATSEDGRGAGILSQGGTITLVGCQLINHQVVGGKGLDGSLFSAPTAGAHGQGAAIWNSDGQVYLTNCLVAENGAKGGVAGTSSSQPIRAAGNGFGGALFSMGGKMVLHHCTLSLNTAVGGDPIGNLGGFGASGGGFGGAIFASATLLQISECTVQSNKVIGIDAKFPISSGGGGAQGGGVAVTSGQILIDQSSFFDNGAFAGNGARQSSPPGDAAGGAIYNAADLRLMDTLLSSNRCVAGTGVTPGQAYGGALGSIGTLALNACTFVGNEVVGGAGSQQAQSSTSGGRGAGGAVFCSGSFGATNITVAFNHALGGSGGGFGGPSPAPGGTGQGGGLGVDGGTGTVVHASFLGNLARGGPLGGLPQGPRGPSQGGGVAGTAGAISLIDSLIAQSLSGSNCFGNVIDGGHNISDDASCNFSAAGSLNNTDPVLGQLDDYGGLTPTVPLLAGSPAIDAGSPAACPPLDQRGRVRPYGAACDIGAFESSPPYVISGTLRGVRIPSGVTVFDATTSVTTDQRGAYRLQGLAAGNHTLVPSDPKFVFVPRQRVIALGPDALNVDFSAYVTNSLSPEKLGTNRAHFVFAGAPDATWRVQATTNFHAWVNFSTNTTDATGLFGITDPDAALNQERFFRTIKP